MNEVLNYVLSAVCNPTSLIMVLAGTCMGLIFGALPFCHNGRRLVDSYDLYA